MSVSISCYKCAVVFSVPDALYEKLKECHNTFYCPNGHGQQFTGEPDKAKYLRWYKDEREQKNQALRRISALQGVITRMKKPILLVFMERKLIKAALKETDGHRVKAARLLGISIRTIFRKIKKYNL